MSPTNSPVAVVVPSPASLPAVRLALPAVEGASFRGAGRRHGLGRLLCVLGGFGQLLVVAYTFPLAILAVGIPIALFVRLAVGTVRALWQL